MRLAVWRCFLIRALSERSISSMIPTLNRPGFAGG
jgi:hypothetical protein